MLPRLFARTISTHASKRVVREIVPVKATSEELPAQLKKLDEELQASYLAHRQAHGPGYMSDRQLEKVYNAHARTQARHLQALQEQIEPQVAESVLPRRTR